MFELERGLKAANRAIAAQGGNPDLPFAAYGQDTWENRFEGFRALLSRLGVLDAGACEELEKEATARPLKYLPAEKLSTIYLSNTAAKDQPLARAFFNHPEPAEAASLLVLLANSNPKQTWRHMLGESSKQLNESQLSIDRLGELKGFLAAGLVHYAELNARGKELGLDETGLATRALADSLRLSRGQAPRDVDLLGSLISLERQHAGNLNLFEATSVLLAARLAERFPQSKDFFEQESRSRHMNEGHSRSELSQTLAHLLAAADIPLRMGDLLQSDRDTIIRTLHESNLCGRLEIALQTEKGWSVPSQNQVQHAINVLNRLWDFFVPAGTAAMQR